VSPLADDDAAHTWTEVRLRVLPAAVEAASDAVSLFTGRGVVIEPAIEALGPDEGYLVDASAPQTLTGYFRGPVSPSRRRGLRRALASLGLADALAAPLTWRTLREEDWANSWKEHYQVQRVGRIAIRPVWRDYSPGEGELMISLDPGMAFGTGQHPTTRMCLAALQELIEPGASVLDLGTGSGVLALAAISLGASSCLALDIEEQAVSAARENVRLNRAEQLVRVEHRSLDPWADGPFELIVANIHASAIVALAADLARVARPNAPLVAGGVIEPRLAEVEAALGAAGWTIERILADGEWRTLIARRHS
jgi:ribosomal protein L11 methyltransferase